MIVFGPGLSIAHIGPILINSKSKIEKGTTYGDVPAKKISENSSAANLVNATEIVDKMNQNEMEIRGANSRILWRRPSSK